jgi:hypothetical protein
MKDKDTAPKTNPGGPPEWILHFDMSHFAQTFLFRTDQAVLYRICGMQLREAHGYQMFDLHWTAVDFMFRMVYRGVGARSRRTGRQFNLRVWAMDAVAELVEIGVIGPGVEQLERMEGGCEGLAGWVVEEAEREGRGLERVDVDGESGGSFLMLAVMWEV